MSFHELMKRLQLPADQVAEERAAMVQRMISAYGEGGASPDDVIRFFRAQQRQVIADLDATNPRLAESLLEPTARLVADAAAVFRRAIDLDP